MALSGGADSAVCAWAAAAAGLPVRAVTVDHGLPESAALVAAAADIAAHLGLEHTVVPARSDSASEAALRDARYATLEAAARPGETLVSGHTEDDQAETTLGNLLRGAGAAGLAGIPVSRGRWHRPMLGVTRQEARAAAADLGLPFADDPGNEDPAIRRSRLRTEVLPMLERVNPAVRRALVRAARLSAADDDALEARAAAVPAALRHGEVRVPAAALATLPDAVASRVARRGLRLLLDPYAGDLGDVEAVLEVARGAARSASISTGLVASREGPFVTIHRPGPLDPPAPAALGSPGEVRFGRWRVEAVPVGAAPQPGHGRWMLALPPGEPLVVRAAAPGDTVAMAGGSKDAFDALREAGVPSRLRPVWPAVERAGRMVWLVGVRRAAGVAAAPGTPAVMLRAGEAM